MPHLTLLSIFSLNSGPFSSYIHAVIVFDIFIPFSLYLQVVDINIYTHSNLKPVWNYFFTIKGKF